MIVSTAFLVTSAVNAPFARRQEWDALCRGGLMRAFQVPAVLRRTLTCSLSRLSASGVQPPPPSTGRQDTSTLRILCPVVLAQNAAARDGTWRRWRKLWRTHIALVALLRATDRPVLLLRNGEPSVRRAMSLLKLKLFFLQVCFFIVTPTLSTEL